MSRFTLEDISKLRPEYQRQVSAQLHPMASPSPTAKTPTTPKEPAKNRIRQNSAGLNKTEQAFKDYLSDLTIGWGGEVRSQSITLKLGNGVRYTPDFTCRKNNGEWFAWEVKGFLRDDANAKLKVAAAMYPEIKFSLVTRKKGAWQIQEVLP